MIPWLWVAPDWVHDWVQYWASKFNNRDRRAILRIWAKWLPVKKYMWYQLNISCTSIRGIMWYLQNMKFLWSILWSGGMCTDNTYITKVKSMIPYYDEIMNHNYIGSLGCIPNEPKTTMLKSVKLFNCVFITNSFPYLPSKYLYHRFYPYKIENVTSASWENVKITKLAFLYMWKCYGITFNNHHIHNS